MKKNYGTASLIFAIITLAAAVLSPILAHNASLVAWVIAGLLALSALGMWILPSFVQNKLLTLVPVLALYAVSDYIRSMLTSLLSQVGPEAAGALPTYFEFETLGLMLTIAFAVASVFVFKKGYKWAITVTTVYSSLMLVCQLQLFLTYAMAADSFNDTKATAALLLMALAFVAAYATQVAMFAGIEVHPEVATAAPAEKSPEEDAPAAE